MNLPSFFNLITTCPNLPIKMIGGWVGAVLLVVGFAAESHAQMNASLNPTWGQWAYNIDRHGEATGSITVNTTGGTAPFSFQWSTGDTVVTISGLVAGWYEVIVEDSTGTIDTLDITLTQAPNLTVAATPSNSCIGGGLASAHPYGGVAPYRYLWSTTNGSTHVNGDTTDAISGLAAGQYTVLVVALNGDSATGTCTIMGPVVLELDVTANGQGNHIACDGDTAVVHLTASGGYPPYTYLWEGGLFSQHLHTTTAGMKRVRVWESHGCTADDSVLVVAATPLELDATPHVYPNGQAFSCDTCNDGMLIIHEITGGVPPYTIAWNTGASGDTLFGIHADSLIGLTITDQQGCTDGGEMTLPRGQLDEIFNMEVSPTLSHYAGGYQVSCHGCTNGSIALHVTGGVPPYHFAWSTGDTLSQLDSLAAGSYTVVVTDSYTNEVELHFPLYGPSNALGVMISTGGVQVCNGAMSGMLMAMTSGGVPPYTYLWSVPSGTMLPPEAYAWSQLNVSVAGTYSVKVTDATGMVDSATQTLSTDGGLAAWAVPVTRHDEAHAGCGVHDGEIELHLHGGKPPYTVHGTGQRSDRLPDADASRLVFHVVISDSLLVVDSLAAANYSITVMDAGGCTQHINVEVRSPDGYRVFATPVELPNGQYASCDSCADVTVNALAPDAFGSVQYVWVEYPAEHAPFKLRGASIAMPGEDMADPEWFESGFPYAVGTGVQHTELATETMYVVAAMDELGCLAQTMLTVERPRAKKPAWGLHGNDGTGAEVAGEGEPWFGTADSSDVVMKANGVPQLRLGANGVTTVEGQLRLAGLQEAVQDTLEPQLRLLVADNYGNVTKIDLGDEFPHSYPYPGYPNPCKYALDGYQPYWDKGVNKIFVNDCYGQVNVGIGTEHPQSRLHVAGDVQFTGERLHVAQNGNVGIGTSNPNALLHVAGRLRAQDIRINSPENHGHVNLCVRGSASDQVYGNSALEVQTFGGDPAFNVFNSGKITIGEYWEEDMHNGFMLQMMGGLGNNGFLLNKNSTGYGMLVRVTNPNAKAFAMQFKETGSEPEERFWMNGYGEMYLKHHLSVGTTDRIAKVTFKNTTGPGLFVRTDEKDDHSGLGGIISSVGTPSTPGLSVYYNANAVFNVWGDGNAFLCGQFKSKGIVVESDWCDYVFEDKHRKHSLEEIENFTTEHKHLPMIPSEKDISDKGLNVGEVMKGQMFHVEEIYLHLIELRKEMDRLKEENEQLRREMNTLSNKK